MTASDYAALEARVAELEQQMRHILPAKIDATNYAISLVHADTQSIREVLDYHSSQFERHGQMLGEILRRLPDRASNGPSGGQDDH
jgi:hypothetical protein